MSRIAVISTALFVLLGASSVAGASECQDWQTKHPEWLWCDDFEDTSTLKSRYEDVSTNGFGRSAGDGYQDSASLRQTYVENQSQAGWVIKVRNEGYPDHVFYRYYHKFGTGYTESPPKCHASAIETDPAIGSPSSWFTPG